MIKVEKWMCVMSIISVRRDKANRTLNKELLLLVISLVA